MRMSLLVGTCLAAIFLTGCTDRGDPLRFGGGASSYSFASAGEWAAVSAEAAKAAALAAGVAGKPVYVQPRDELMAYSGGMHDLLQAQLLAAGVPVVQFPAGAVVLRYDVDPVASPVRVAYGIGQTQILLTWEVLEGNAVIGQGVHPVLVPDHELVNYVAWSGSPWLNPPPMDLSALPTKQMAIVGHPGDDSEAAQRMYQRMLRK